jgi:hypothetical protein
VKSTVVDSNQKVIQILTSALALAQKNQFRHVAIVLSGHSTQDDVSVVDYAGEQSLEPVAEAGFIKILANLRRSINNWKLPVPDPKLDESWVVYNVAGSPLSFDFVSWLVDAEMNRVRAGAPAPLKVGFWCGRDADKRMQHDNREGWHKNVFRPLVSMIKGVEVSQAVYGHHKPLFVPRDVVAAANAGEKVPRLSSGLPPWYPGGDAYRHQFQYVTITLREASHWENRNSNVPAWLKFATWLLERGEDVVIVRDTEKALEPLQHFITDPVAAASLPKRMSLYENAKANLFVANGPHALALYSDRPWLCFVDLKPDGDQYTPNTPWFWKTTMGVEPRGQFPWSNEQQRLVWSKDDYANIVEAWNTLALS